MIRKRLSTVFSSKLFYIAFSIFFAFLLWMYVEINENQVQPHIVRDVQVVRLNEEILNDRGLLISAITPETVTLTIECPRSVALKLTNTTLTASIDLAGITMKGNSTIRYDIVYPSNVDINSIGRVWRSVERISLYIDRQQTRPVPVEVIYEGGAAEGYIKDPLEFTPQTITVSGPAEAVSSVSTARVNIIRENLSSTYIDDLPFTLMDEDGNELEESISEQLTCSDETIHVTVPVRVVKEVVLTVDFNYGSGATPQNTTFTIDPPTVIIAGEPDDVRDFNSINLGTIDLTGFAFTDTQAFTIVIPNHFTRISGETEALVYVEIIGLEIRHFSVSSIHTVYDPPSGYTAEIMTQSVDVRIRGKPEDMEDLTESNIRVVADLTNVSPGMQLVPARVIVDGVEGDVGAIDPYYVTIAILKES